MKKLIVITVVSTVAYQANANTNKQVKRLDFESFFESTNKETNFYTSLLVNRNGNKVVHNENFADASYASLNETSDISTTSPGIEIMREFFESKYISIGLSARGSILRGGGDFEINTITYEDELRAYEYGGGLSLNLNTVGYGMRIQPFLSSHYMMTDGEIKIKYDANNSNTDTTLNYKMNNDRFVHSLGMRFIDKKEGFASFFSLDYNQIIKDRTTLEATNGSQSLQASGSAIEYDKMSLTVGFGFAF